jgi:hypothetical protein
MLAGFLARRVFLSSALPDLSLARWLAREILSCACLPAAAQAVAPAAYSAFQADAEPVVADSPDRTVLTVPCFGVPVQAALTAQAAGDPAVATAAIPFDCR